YIREKGIFIFCELFRHLHNEERTFIDFVYEELESLLAGPRTTDNFSMSPPRRIQSRPGDIIPDIDVYPVEMLKTITAQIGYRRMPYTKRDPATGRIEIPKLISSGVYLVDDSIWYPGFEGRGEGIFITFSDGNIPEFSESRAHEEWRRYGGSSNLTGTPWGDIPREPLFVWLHTLSHALIMAISLHSGYSSASLRERVYINRNADNGGILIYTTSPGEDGSLGGLIGAVDIFEEILKMASERIRLCSNDPLCSEVRKTPERINGAACHSCLLISETSCEHRNMWLDRHIILRD
ncbi:MAG: DrmB family protein, partial [Candidatus Syntropharchaeia archaeon]